VLGSKPGTRAGQASILQPPLHPPSSGVAILTWCENSVTLFVTFDLVKLPAVLGFGPFLTLQSSASSRADRRGRGAEAGGGGAAVCYKAEG
jgi:hypothetical protein